VLGPSQPEALARILHVLGSPRAFAMPPDTVALIAPTGEVEYEALRSEWIALTERTRAAVAEVPTALHETTLIRHPLGGPLALGDVLDFLAAHVRHHEYQLDRIEAGWTA
jgi:hypothetical protein